MTSLERVFAVIEGRIPDKVPVALHNFLFAARLAGIPMSQAFQNGELLAETQLAAWRRLRHDMVMLENGTGAMAQAMGCKVVYADDHPPYVVEPVIRGWDDIDKLTIPDPTKTFPLTCLLEATRILRAEIGNEVFLQSRSDQAPLALASALRGYEQFFMDLADPEHYPYLNKLTAICRQAIERLSLALKEVGAHGTCIGEFGSATISPGRFRSLAVPRLQEYFQTMRKHRFVSTLHQCGNALTVLDDIVDIGADILELDPLTDMAAAKRAACGKIAISGMIDPSGVLRHGNPQLVDERCKEAIAIVGAGGGFMLGAGCALSQDTPLENLDALMAARDRYGKYSADGSWKERL